jgi:hypothetical protein
VHVSQSLFVYFVQRVVCALLRMALFGNDNEMEDNKIGKKNSRLATPTTMDY